MVAAPLTGPGHVFCPRCGATLFRHPRASLTTLLAIVATSVILFIVVNVFPFLTFELEGREQTSHLISGVYALIDSGLVGVGILVFCVTILAPLLRIALISSILVPLALGRRPAAGPRLFRWQRWLRPWTMTEIFLLGVAVAYVKLSSFATLELHPAVFAFGAMILTMIATDVLIDARWMWEKLAPSPPAPIDPMRPEEILTCECCHLVVPLVAESGGTALRCPRCSSTLHFRKPNGIGRTWALVIAAIIMYVPANLYPVMTVVSFGQGEADTILSGVVAFIQAGMWPLALLVFFASITVPMLKLVGLCFLLISVQVRSQWRPRDRTVLYRIIDAVGRWSMIDVFMISILVALVKLDAIATIVPGPGAAFFTAVVVVTMIAAECFDPRTIWDAADVDRDG